MTVSLRHCSTIRKSIITARQRSCGMIMFSVVSVCHSVHQVGWGSHVTIIHDALGPHHTRIPVLPLQTWDLRNPLSALASLPWTRDLTVKHPCLSLLVTSGGLHWRPVQACFTWAPPPTVLTSGGYWSAYGLHVRLCILLECFLVFSLSQLGCVDTKGKRTQKRKQEIISFEYRYDKKLSLSSSLSLGLNVAKDTC